MTLYPSEPAVPAPPGPYSWPPHPAADAFPVLEGTDFEGFVETIDQDGQLEPIVLYRDEADRLWLLDGRNRDRALRRLGREPQVVEWAGECGSPTAFVIARNVHRRHLTASQRAAIGARLLPALKAEARERQRLAAERTNALRRMRRAGETAVPAGLPEAPPFRGEAREIAASLVGASARSVSLAAAIQARAADLVEEVIAGRLTLAEARRQAERRANAGEPALVAEPAAELAPEALRSTPVPAEVTDAADALQLLEGVVRYLERPRSPARARKTALARTLAVLSFLQRARRGSRA